MTTRLSDKHEQFAHHLARGMGINAAYEAAGYSAHSGNASVLAKDPRIRKRVDELREIAQRQTIDSMKVDRAYVIAGLVHVAEVCMGRRPVMGKRRGRPPKSRAVEPLDADDKDAMQLLAEVTTEWEETWRFDPAGANKALELLGKQLGMFQERNPNTYDRKSDALEKEIRDIAAAVLELDPTDPIARALTQAPALIDVTPTVEEPGK